MLPSPHKLARGVSPESCNFGNARKIGAKLKRITEFENVGKYTYKREVRTGADRSGSDVDGMVWYGMVVYLRRYLSCRRTIDCVQFHADVECRVSMSYCRSTLRVSQDGRRHHHRIDDLKTASFRNWCSSCWRASEDKGFDINRRPQSLQH